MNDVSKFASLQNPDLMKLFVKRSSRKLLRSLKTNKVICAKPYFVGLARIPAVKHPEKMYGTLNRPIWVNVKQPDGSFTQKLEKVKIALKKGLIKTA